MPTAPTSPGVHRMRMFTWWTLVLTLVGGTGAGLVEVLRPALPIGLLATDDAPTQPISTPLLTGLVLAIVVVVAVSGRLFHAAVFGWSTRHGRALPWYVAVGGLAAGATMPLSDALATTWPWTLFAATLTSAVVVGSRWPRWRVAGAGVALAALLAALEGWITGSSGWLPVVGAVMISTFLTGTVVLQVWFWEGTVRLDRARQAEGEVAVTGERQRFAAELHDIQGHSLQAIVLKSELAARLVGTDPVHAAAQMREVEALARQALRDTHGVVEGYRAVSLDTEINNATRVLAAAGVDCRMRCQPDEADLSEGDERLLGLVVREGTTNVIRHSRARRAEIALVSTAGQVRLRFHNDAPMTARPDPDRVTSGGLAGLAHRFEAAGGRLTWQSAADGFTVVASLPAGAG
ncbi:sensor histidine kinase [Plantactinospora sp. WMMB334]|uniref:sensor histidine kinase n=1 Tax=Plantactinospora sp. WMMB334 TaxID=3404119 RepID=UPI003B955B9C